MEIASKAQMIPVLKAEGRRASEIARELKCSRQYVHEVLHGKKKKARPQEDPRKPEYEEMLTVTEAAHFLRVTANTMRRWSESGVIDSYRIGPRKDRRFKTTDVTEYLRSYGADGVCE